MTWTQARPSRETQKAAVASRIPVATQPGPPAATLVTSARGPDPSTIDGRQVWPPSTETQAAAIRRSVVSVNPPATRPSVPAATDVMAAAVAPAPRAVAWLTVQRRPSTEVQARGFIDPASVPTATKPWPTATTAVTIPSSAPGTW